ALREELVLVGGCAVGLLITVKSHPTIRPTVDIDLITEVTPLANYYDFCERLREKGFKESSSSEVLCRWRLGELTVDIMPTEEGVLKFTNSWYSEAARTAVTHELPGGTRIKVITAPLFLATKLESFHSRGNGDFMHH
ncbi:hypothetical protein, partial [Staphylococcus aureus]|uniref:hypothetical protein n=1 Tax=Staphylococcus aureus TaxID=1280 RepID=UPI0039BE195B